MTSPAFTCTHHSEPSGETPARMSHPSVFSGRSPADEHQAPAGSAPSSSQVKKKSGFQITSVLPAQVSASANDSIADDTESYDDMDESHTEDLSSSDILDASRATGVPERSSSEETLNSLHGGETPNEHPQGHMVNGTHHHHRTAPKAAQGRLTGGRVVQDGAALPAVPDAFITTAPPPCSASTASRFRVVKLDSNSEPFRKGRWMCAEFYERDGAGGDSAAHRTVENIIHSEHESVSGSSSGSTLSAGDSHEPPQGTDAALRAPQVALFPAEAPMSPAAQPPPARSAASPRAGPHAPPLGVQPEPQQSSGPLLRVPLGGVTASQLEDAQRLLLQHHPLLSLPRLTASGGPADAACTGADEDSSTGASVVAIDNKIEQAMDLVKSHLMYAVREEVEVLKEQIKELMERNSQLEQENTLLKNLATPEQLAQFQVQVQDRSPTAGPQQNLPHNPQQNLPQNPQQNLPQNPQQNLPQNPQNLQQYLQNLQQNLPQNSQQNLQQDLPQNLQQDLQHNQNQGPTA